MRGLTERERKHERKRAQNKWLERLDLGPIIQLNNKQWFAVICYFSDFFAKGWWAFVSFSSVMIESVLNDSVLWLREEDGKKGLIWGQSINTTHSLSLSCLVHQYHPQSLALLSCSLLKAINKEIKNKSHSLSIAEHTTNHILAHIDKAAINLLIGKMCKQEYARPNKHLWDWCQLRLISLLSAAHPSVVSV